MKFGEGDRVVLLKSVGSKNPNSGVLQQGMEGNVIEPRTSRMWSKVKVIFDGGYEASVKTSDIEKIEEKREKDKSGKILRPYIHEGNDRDSILGNSKNLDALGDMLKMKAKLGSSFKATFYDGVNKPIDIEIDTELLGEE